LKNRDLYLNIISGVSGGILVFISSNQKTKLKSIKNSQKLVE